MKNNTMQKNKKFKIKNKKITTPCLGSTTTKFVLQSKIQKIIRLIYHSKYEQVKIHSRQIGQKHRIK
jgi:hypothetical protein